MRGADLIRAVLMRAIDGATAVLLAPTCAACDSPLDSPVAGAVCPRCWAAIVPITPPFCATCGDALPTWRAVSLAASRCPRCRRTPSPIARARALGRYDGTLRAIVHALKYDGRTTLARALAERMRRAAPELFDGADAVVPVPLHRRRRRARGFNQAHELARHLGLPLLNALRRTRQTLAQADLPAARRHANVRGAFEWRTRVPVAGLTLVLVDDVSTTGATLASCAAPLLDAGAVEVRAMTAAKAVTRWRP